jgi:sporulation protein YlmC with PRC-barrel domain
MKSRLLVLAAVSALALSQPAFSAESTDDIRAFTFGKTTVGKAEPETIRRGDTARGMIGSPVLNPAGDKIADVKDIIISRDGKAVLLVVSDGGVLGIGSKVAAFDYNRVVTRKDDGSVIMTLSQDMIDHAADFSYDPKDWAKAKVIPQGSISVSSILDGEVIDNKNRTVATVENVYLRDTDVSQIIVGFNKKLGVAGDRAALDYDSLQPVRTKKEVDFRLSADQAARFRQFEKSMAN